MFIQKWHRKQQKEKTQMFETGAKSVIEKILPVIDNFERGLSAVPANAIVDNIFACQQFFYNYVSLTITN